MSRALFVGVACSRLADRSADHHGRPPPHHALLHLLLSVLSAEVLLLRPLPLLPSDLLLPRKRWRRLSLQLLEYSDSLLHPTLAPKHLTCILFTRKAPV